MTPKSATAVKISSFIVTAEITATFSFYCLRKIHGIYLYEVVSSHFTFTLHVGPFLFGIILTLHFVVLDAGGGGIITLASSVESLIDTFSHGLVVEGLVSFLPVRRNKGSADSSSCSSGLEFFLVVH